LKNWAILGFRGWWRPFGALESADSDCDVGREPIADGGWLGTDRGRAVACRFSEREKCSLTCWRG